MEQVIKIRKQLIGLYKADGGTDLFKAYNWLERFLIIGRFEIPIVEIDIEAWKKKIGWDEMRVGAQQQFIKDKIQPIVNEILDLIVEQMKEQEAKFDQVDRELSYCLMKCRELLIEHSFILAQ